LKPEQVWIEAFTARVATFCRPTHLLLFSFNEAENPRVGFSY
jgi:hypothetical protein